MADIFEAGTVPPSVDPSKDYYSELVGDDRPYKTNQDLARSVMEKEAFIQRLKAEKDGVLQDLQGRMKLEDALAKIERLTTPSTEPPEPPREPGSGVQQPDYEKLIEQGIAAADAKRRRENNAREVQQKLIQTYGENFATRVKSEVLSLGMTEAQANAIAVDNPQAFYRMLGIGSQAPRQQSVTAPQSAMTFTPNTNDPKTYQYYEKLRKSNPTEYWSGKTQNEMMKQLATLGQEDFYK